MSTLPGPFHRLFAAATTSNLADGLVLVGIPLLALRVTREPILISGIQAVFTLPWLLLALQAGALADRRGRRGLLVGAATLRGVVLALAGVAALTGNLTLATIYLTVFIVGCGEVLFDTTSQSLVPAMVGRDDLGRANGRLIGAQTVMNNFVGALLAGLLVAAAGAAVLLGPAALYLATAALLTRLPHGYRPEARPPATMRADIAEGLRHLLHHPTLRALGLLGAVLNLANAAYFGVIVLFVVGEDSPMGLPEAAFGVLAAILAAGSVTGSLLAARVEARFGPRRTLLTGVAGTSLLMVTPLVTTAAAPIAAMAFLMGLTSVLVNVVGVSSRQRIVPSALLGRVNASFRLLVMGAMPLGAAVGGAIASATDLRVTFAVAVCLQLLALVLLHRPITDAALQADANLSPTLTTAR
jgi:MFS family permease